MDFNYYCRHCGSKVEEIDPINEMRTYKCECTELPLGYKDVIAGYTRDARITQLKAMHTLMLNANNESLYMSWIYTMPDEPSEMDFKEIAINDSSYNDCWDKFLRLAQKNGMRW